MTTRTIELWQKADEELKQKLIDETQRCPDTLNSLFQPDCYFGSLTDALLDLMEEFGEEQKKKRGRKRREFEDMLKLKAMNGLCCPGEPVGLLAAQVCSFEVS